jgi:hypothetical protein
VNPNRERWAEDRLFVDAGGTPSGARTDSLGGSHFIYLRIVSCGHHISKCPLLLAVAHRLCDPIYRLLPPFLFFGCGVHQDFPLDDRPPALQKRAAGGGEGAGSYVQLESIHFDLHVNILEGENSPIPVPVRFINKPPRDYVSHLVVTLLLSFPFAGEWVNTILVGCLLVIVASSSE